MVFKGEVYFADLDPTKGSEQAGKRPVLVFQNDLISNYSRTIVIIPFTTNLKRANLPGCVLIPKGEGGLPEDSVAICYQIRVIDKMRLSNKIVLSTNRFVRF